MSDPNEKEGTFNFYYLNREYTFDRAFFKVFNILPFLLNFCYCIGQRKLGYLIVLSRPLTILRVEASVWFEPRKINLICTTGHRP